MKDMLFGLLVGILLGAVGHGMYYDGVVSRDYNYKLQQSFKALDRASKQIQDRDNDINYLLKYIDNLKDINKELENILTKKTV